MEWKWKKPPKPHELRKLLPAVRDMASITLKEMSPAIARLIVRRLRSRSLLAHRGQLKAIPEYSDNYKRKLKARGESTVPDYTVTGTLLNHLSGRLKGKNVESVELVINPHGRASSPSGNVSTKIRRGTKREGRSGYWWKPPYSYTRGNSTSMINVPGHWVKTLAKEDRKKRPKAVYNAHLANLLALRLGGGNWAKIRSGEETLNSFITLSHKEHAAVETRLTKRNAVAAGKVIEKVAGG